MAAIEEGCIFFFYRPKIDTEAVHGLDDVQRSYVVLAPEASDRGRLLVVGRKRMPDLPTGEPHANQRDWMLVESVESLKDIGRGLGPLRYETKTRGTRQQPQAVPVGVGRYALTLDDDGSRLGYRLSQPSRVGEAQHALGLPKEASFIVSVRNPDLDVPGFPSTRPAYPKKLAKLFQDRRWLEVRDPELLDHENAQLLWIGAEARAGDAVSDANDVDLFATLGLRRDDWQLESLQTGHFPPPVADAPTEAPAGDRTKGGRRGGAAARQSASAVGIARALGGIEFPRKRAGLVSHAREQEAPPEVIETIQQLPDRKFENMADVERALGEVR